MKRVLFFAVLAAIILTGCNLNVDGPSDSGETAPFDAGDRLTYTAGLVSFNMVYVPGGITFPTGSTDSVPATVTNAYEIGETELTYGLWSAVYMWAVSNSYIFANPGREGHDGTIGGSVVGTEPVTTINWWDAMVWTNALTEYFNDQNGTNLSCVYKDGVTIIRDSRAANAGQCDSVTPDSAATGFRLLSQGTRVAVIISSMIEIDRIGFIFLDTSTEIHSLAIGFILLWAFPSVRAQ